MTIIYPGKFNQARPANFDGVFDWDFLKPVFEGTNIEPMDIDAIVERKGKFIIFETKNLNKDIPLGQQITLNNLVIQGKGNICVFILWGKSHKEISAIQEWHYKNNSCIKSEILICDSDYILERVSAWFNWANK